MQSYTQETKSVIRNIILHYSASMKMNMERKEKK